MGLKEWLVPQNKMFFRTLQAEAKNVLEGANALKDLLMDFRDVKRKCQDIKDIEHQGDMIVHQICEALNKTFVTPIDREDISALASSMDDVLDHINSASIRLYIFKIERPTEPMIKFADIIIQSMLELNNAILKIESMKNANEIEKRCVEVNRLENVADDLLHDSMKTLFEDRDVIMIIKLKEIYDHLEMATDRCEDVANIISDVVAKYR